MKSEDEKASLNEPSTSYEGKYSYADYLTWKTDEMMEIIKGRLFKIPAPPGRVHQKAALKLGSALLNFLDGKPCEVYVAPFDVRLPTTSTKNEEVNTVVQPDLCVICDKSKLDEAGCIGAPDLVVEILSRGNNKKELQNKYEVYQESGVKEYWIIHPIERTLLIYSLKVDGFAPSKLFTAGDHIGSAVIPGFTLDLEEFFSDLD
ncbi:MAG TPA: Uma2 family endonuclease [Cyclobacteriaceae bacterium]|nr:Uma2 family endonuclease [Cyclobacteriaceae bacterium]